MAVDRQQIEASLRQSEERYRAFVEQSSEAIWRFELREPLPVTFDPDEQIEHCYRHAYLAECNDTMARMYGYERAGDIVGAQLDDFMPRANAANVEYLRAFIQSGYRLTEAESHEVDRDGNPKYFLNNLIGIVEDGKMLRAWGTQRDITQHKRIEEELRNTQVRMQSAIKAGAIATWTWDVVNDRVIGDKNLARLFSVSEQDSVGGPLESYARALHPEDQPRVLSVISQALASGDFYEADYRIIQPDNSVRWVSSRGRVERDAAGNPLRLPGVIVDITERKKQEMQLQELSLRLEQQNQLFNATLSHISDFTYIFDRDGRFLYANQALLDLWGLHLEDTMGKNFFDLQYPDDLAARLQQQIQQVFETRQGLTDETPYTSPTGVSGYYEYIFRPVFAADGSVEVVAGSTRDVTKYKQDEQIAREGEARYRQLANAMPQLVWTCDAEGVVDYYNSRLADYVEMTPETEGHWLWQPLLHSDDVAATMTAWRAAMETGEPYEFEHRIQMRDGGYCWHLSRARPVCDAEGHIVKWFGTATDIDSNKRVELNAQFLIELDAQLNRLTTPEEIEQQAVQRVGEYVGVDSCYFGVIKGTRATAQHEWRRGGPSIPSEVEITDFFSAEAMTEQQADASTVVSDVARDPRTVACLANYAALEISAFVTTPVNDRSQWVVALNVISRAPRTWRAAEVKLLRDVAGRVWPLIERARAVATVQESEASFRTLANAVPQIVWVSGGDGVKLDYINEQWVNYTGLSYEESLRDANQAVHPDDVATVVEKWQRSFQSGKPYESEMRLRRADGQYRWFLARSVPLREATGQIVRWFGTSTDIHEQKQTEDDARLLADIGERIRLAKDTPSLLWEVTRAVGEHLQVSNAFFTEVEMEQGRFQIHRDYHVGPRSFAGSYARSAFGPQLIKELMAGHVVVVRDAATDHRIADSLDNFNQNGIGASVTVPLLRNDRQVSSLIVTTTKARDWTPREITLLETVAERTWLAVEKLRLDAQAHSANERFERAESAAHGYVFEWDVSSGHIVRSRNFTSVFGYALDEVPPTVEGWIALIHPDDVPNRREHIALILDGDASNYSGEYRVRHKAGYYVWVLEQGIIERDQTGRTLRLVGTTIDITPHKQAEEQIAHLLKEEQTARAEAERATRLKDEFLGLVSHELRSPLNAISGWIKLLRGGRLTPDDTAKALATIERNAVAQNHLIEDLLDVSRVVAGKLKLEPQVIEPHAFIEAAFDTARPAAEAKGVRLELLSAPLGIALNADPNRLQQAVWNLLSNAIKFTPAGGHVSIKLAHVNNRIEITISDTGIGIEPDFLPYVFERFRQANATSNRKYGGLGLGLAIVRHIVELHGGEVEADSAGEGHGAAFTLKLPLAAAGQTVKQPPATITSFLELPAAIAARLAGLRVLVIDDEEADRDMLQVMLNNYGLRVTKASSAAEGLQALSRDQFDALVCDISMPDEDGYAFIRQVREQEVGRGSRIPAIALTGYARAEDRVRTLGAGFNSHVSKPVEPVELAIVMATLAERSGR